MKKISVCFVILTGAFAVASLVAAQDSALIEAARKEGRLAYVLSVAVFHCDRALFSK